MSPDARAPGGTHVADTPCSLGFPDMPRLELDQPLVHPVDRADDVLPPRGGCAGLRPTRCTEPCQYASSPVVVVPPGGGQVNTPVAATCLLLAAGGKGEVRPARRQDVEAVRADAARTAVERRPGGYACASSTTVRAHQPFAWARQRTQTSRKSAVA